MYIGEIIKNYRMTNNLSQRGFAARTTLSPSYINTLEKIYNPKTGKPYSVTTDVAKEIANAMHISIEELLSKIDNNQEFTINNTNIDKKIYMCPVYGRIAAGMPNWAEDCIDSYLPIDPSLMDIINPEECYFLKVNR